MAANPQVRDFLTSRRAQVTPDVAGLPAYGGNRRVPGLRREEVALLAGVSVADDNRLERGNLAGVSDSVLDAVARALQLDLEFEAMTLTSDPDLTFVAYTAQPGSASADALRMLAGWAATQDHDHAVDDALATPAAD